MNTFMLPMTTKGSYPVLTAVLLTIVCCAFAFVLYRLLRHLHHSRKTGKDGSNTHDGHHGNH